MVSSHPYPEHPHCRTGQNISY